MPAPSVAEKTAASSAARRSVNRPGLRKVAVLGLDGRNPSELTLMVVSAACAPQAIAVAKRPRAAASERFIAAEGVASGDPGGTANRLAPGSCPHHAFLTAAHPPPALF